MKKTTIRRKLVKRFGVLMLLAFIAVFIITRFILQAYMTKVIEDDIKEELSIISVVLREELNNADNRNITAGKLAESLRSGRKRLGYFNLDSQMMIITNINGNLRTAAGEGELGQEDLDFVESLVRDKRFNKSVSYTRNDKEEFRLFLAPVGVSEESSEEAKLYAMLYFQIDEELKVVQNFSLVLFLILGTVYILCLVLMYIMAYRMTKPLKKLRDYADELAKDTNIDQIHITTGDEIESLATSMNIMALELGRANEEQARFLQNASHELKTPLMSIQGYAEGIQDRVIEDENEALNTIIEESIRLKGVVNQLSLLSKINSNVQNIEMGLVNVTDCVNDSILRVAKLAEEKNVSISLKSDEMKEYSILGDYNRLIQVFINLLSNGLRYARNEIEISVTSDNDKVRIRVKDDGNGIREVMIPHIFERFYKGSDGQTGLGLAIVKAIVEQFDGEIQVYNTSDRGACFDLEFKISNESPEK